MTKITMLAIFFVVCTIYIKQSEGFYENDLLYEVTAFNSQERSVLYKLQTSSSNIAFLNGITNEAAMPIRIIVNKCCTENFENKLQQEGIQYKLYENLSPMSTLFKKTLIDQAFYNQMSKGFKKFEDINKWIATNLEKHTNLQKMIMANTYEKRELFILSVEKYPNRPSVILIGGERGSDWVSPNVILEFISNLLENRTNSVLLDFYNFYFLPLFNPDGYVYSMEQDRFWGKNRKEFFPKKTCNYQTPGSSDQIAIGVNIERNWYFQKSLGPKDSSECSPLYLGHKPLSEEEPKALAEFIDMHADQVMAFISVKGFGDRLITLPYADNSLHSNNYGVLMEILMAACDKAHERYKSTYLQGTTGRFFYNVSGNSADWIKYQFNIPIVFTIYMKYKEEHFPHESHILPLSQELTTIVNEILTIGKEIYGPLFNNQPKFGFECCVLYFSLAFLQISVFK